MRLKFNNHYRLSPRVVVLLLVLLCVAVAVAVNSKVNQQSLGTTGYHHCIYNDDSHYARCLYVDEAEGLAGCYGYNELRRSDDINAGIIPNDGGSHCDFVTGSSYKFNESGEPL